MISDEVIKKITDWVLANRRGESFKNFPPNLIANQIKEAIKQDVIVLDLEGEVIMGLALGERNDKEQYVFIHNVLTLKPGVVKRFIEFCTMKYPHYSIYGMVRNRYRLINNPTKFSRRLK